MTDSEHRGANLRNASLPDVIWNRQNEIRMTSPANGRISTPSKALRLPRLESWAALQLMAVVLLAGCHSSDQLPDKNSKAYSEYLSTFYVGLAALQVGDDVRADASLGDATKLVPAEPAGWADWGILALRQGNFDTAEQRLNRARDLAPANDRIFYLLGIL
jgi:tetratricopeptide (TPR) repeat protein